MKRISRRTLLTGVAGLSTIAWASYNYGTSWWSDSRIQGQSLNIKLITMGVNGYLAEGLLKGKKSTLLTEVNLKSGWIKQTQLPMTSPHAPSYLPANKIFALSAHSSLSLILNEDHSIFKELRLPNHLVFGGHSLIIDHLGLLAVAIKKRHSNNFDSPGFINFYSLKTYELVRQVGVPSTFAHDLVLTPDNQLVISQYGTLNFDFQKTDAPYFDKRLQATFLMQAVKPTLSYLNLNDFSYTQHRVLNQFHGLNHITNDLGNDIFSVSVQAVRKDALGFAFSNQTYNDPLIFDQKNIDKSSNDDFFSLPSPIDFIPHDLNKEPVQYMGKPYQQVRSQDLVGDPMAGWVASSFPNSGTIGIIKKTDNILNLIETAKWGRPAPRGLSALPDKNLLGICDQEQGLTVININTNEEVCRADFAGYRIIHLDSKRV